MAKKIEVLFPKAQELPQHSQPFNRSRIENNGFHEDIVLASKDGFLRYVSLSVKTLDLAP